MIGNAYSYFTDKLGIGPGLTKAGTTMALASYAEPVAARSGDAGSTTASRITTAAIRDSDDVFMNLMWSDLSGLPPHTSLPKEQSDSKEAMSIAASLEYIFEQTILKDARELFERTKDYNDGNLCLSGGSFLNSNRQHAGQAARRRSRTCTCFPPAAMTAPRWGPRYTSCTIF